MSTSSDKLILGYWNIQGLAQSIRYLLEYLEVEYEDKKYTSHEEWLKDKEVLPMDFPNVPYLNAGKLWFTESLAIIHYVPEHFDKTELLGKTKEDRALVNNALGVISDINSRIIAPVFYGPEKDVAENLAQAFEELNSKFVYLNKFIGNKDYLLGYITVADFLLFYNLDCFLAADSKHVEKFENLTTFYKKFKEIPQIKKYRESGKVPKAYNNFMAGWVGEFKP